MAQARLSVRKIREILRLRADGFSEREIARSVGVARSSIQICLWRAERAGVGWPLPAEQDDAALEALLYPRPKPGIEVLPTPDFEWIERELRRKHVTRRQLWREYQVQYPEGLKCTAFCVKFRQWRAKRSVTLNEYVAAIPGMPDVEKFATIGTVGLTLSSCTTAFHNAPLIYVVEKSKVT